MHPRGLTHAALVNPAGAEARRGTEPRAALARRALAMPRGGCREAVACRPLL